MITAELKEILEDSGCTLVIYEASELANIKTDLSKPADIIGVIIQPTSVRLEVKANAIAEHYPPIIIEIIQQVKLEDEADNNETKYQALLDVCKQVVVRLIATEQFRHIDAFTVTKVPETRYDANVIGWAMPVDLYRLQNENKEPCE